MSTGVGRPARALLMKRSRTTLAALLAASLTLAVGMIGSPVAGAAPAAPALPGAPALPSATALSSARANAGVEQDFVGRINALRSQKGRAPLTVDPELTAAARSWAATMAGEGRIFHSSNLAGGVSARWAKLGENVGVGGDVASLFQAFVDSPSHYANLVDPSYSRVGVGVVVSGNRIYTTHRFMAVAAPAPPPTTAPAPPPTAPPTTAAPTTTAPPTTTTAPPPPPSTTTTTAAPEPLSKLGPLERLSDLVERG